jgi:hypothetical protein
MHLLISLLSPHDSPLSSTCLSIFSSLISQEVLTQLMEAESCGHTYMHPLQRLAATTAALDSVTLEDMNAVTRELCEHLSHIDPAQGVRPAAVVACGPVLDRNKEQFHITEDEVGTMQGNAAKWTSSVRYNI